MSPGFFANSTSLELKSFVSIFFYRKLGLSNWGCSLSTGAAYTLTFTVYLSSKKFSWKEKVLLYKDTSFWFVKLDQNIIALSFYKEILTFSVNIFRLLWLIQSSSV